MAHWGKQCYFFLFFCAFATLLYPSLPSDKPSTSSLLFTFALLVASHVLKSGKPQEKVQHVGNQYFIYCPELRLVHPHLCSPLGIATRRLSCITEKFATGWAAEYNEKIHNFNQSLVFIKCTYLREFPTAFFFLDPIVLPLHLDHMLDFILFSLWIPSLHPIRCRKKRKFCS